MYDFKVSSLFNFYNIENENLFYDLDNIWNMCYENIINPKKNFLELIINFYTNTNNDARYFYELFVKTYKKTSMYILL